MAKSWLNDTVGGSIAGLLAIPEAMAYAVIIFSPLAVHQPEVLPIGILSCITLTREIRRKTRRSPLRSNLASMGSKLPFAAPAKRVLVLHKA